MKDKLVELWDDLKGWAIDSPAQATVAGTLAAALVVGGITIPFMGDDNDNAPRVQESIYVQENPRDKSVDITTVEQERPSYTGSNKITSEPNATNDGNANKEQRRMEAAPPRPPQRSVTPAPRPKVDNVTQREVHELKERRIPPPAPDRVEVAPGAVQHELPRPVHGHIPPPPPVPVTPPPAAPAPDAPKPPATSANNSSAPAAEGNKPQAQANDKKREVIANTIEIKGERYPVLPMGVTKDEQGHNTFAPPENVGQVGWYQDSAEAGTNDEGSILMSAHVNSAQQGSGVGAVFTTLKAGDIITIWNTKGEKSEWRVTKSYENKKDKWELPESANRTTGEQSLVLVTCGGAYVGPPLYYQMNIFTEAEKV